MLARSSLVVGLLAAANAWLTCEQPAARGTVVEVRLFCEISGGCGPGDFFVDNPQALPALEFALQAYEPFADSLPAIPASPGWVATFTDPDTGVPGATVNNLAVPANTLILYAGGYDMPGGQVAEAGPGTANISLSRGQGTITGAAASDFATWGGSIAFDTLDNGSPRNWHFGIDSLPGPGQADFLTLAFHELAHVFGFGTAASFDNLIWSNQLMGAEVIRLTGSGSALTADNNHWLSDTASPPYVDEPFSPLSAAVLLGRRSALTPLDYAALKDLGWQVTDALLGVHGDGNQDGYVDGRDFLNWQREFGAVGPNSGDMDGDLRVDEYDLWLWRMNVGAQLAVPQLAFSVQVPEPNTMCTMLAAALAFACRRRQA